MNTFALRGRRLAFAAVAPLFGFLSLGCAGGTTEAPAYTGDPYVVPSAVKQGGDVAECRNTSECSGIDAGTCKHAQCVDGACVVVNDLPGAVCDEPNGELGECQAARCDSAGACVPSTALDGALCGELDTCTRSVCTGGVCGTPVTRDCDDGDPCTTDSCNPTTGCEWTANSSACDDGDPCTSGDACNAAGLCQGAPSCECKTDGDCTAKDKNKCDGISKCVENKCVNDAATAVDCSSLEKDLEMCESVECNETTGKCEVAIEEYKLCDDGNACTTGEYCNAAGACIVKTVACESNCTDDKDEDGDDDTDCDDVDCKNDSACVSGEYTVIEVLDDPFNPSLAPCDTGALKSPGSDIDSMRLNDGIFATQCELTGTTACDNDSASASDAEGAPNASGVEETGTYTSLNGGLLRCRWVGGAFVTADDVVTVVEVGATSGPNAEQYQIRLCREAPGDCKAPSSYASGEAVFSGADLF